MYRRHGTKEVFELMNTGVFRDAINMIGKCYGWYHSESEYVAMQYAGPFWLSGYCWRAIVRVLVHCRNELPKSKSKRRNWQYTKSGCMNYFITGVLLVPAAKVAHIKFLTPVPRAVVPVSAHGVEDHAEDPGGSLSQETVLHEGSTG